MGILRKRDKAMHMQMLVNLMSFILCLSGQDLLTALAVLVPGGIVEITMGQMANAEKGEMLVGVTLFRYLAKEPGAWERLCKPGMVDQLIKWIAKWLPQVRALVGIQAVYQWCYKRSGHDLDVAE
jgi:hypothetical protein